MVRALVETFSDAWRAGLPPAPWRDDLLQAARWRARRDGLAGSLVDPVEDGIARLLSGGTGATRQRGVAGADHDLDAVVDDVLERTHASAVDPPRGA